MIFVSLALLVAGPVHKERYMHVHHEHGDEHVHDDAEGGDARQESKNQSQTAEKFRTDREKREWRGNVHLRGEESHGSRKAVSSKPTQEFLGAVREKDDAQDQAHESESEVVCGGQQLFEHEHLRAEMERFEIMHRLNPVQLE